MCVAACVDGSVPFSAKFCRWLVFLSLRERAVEAKLKIKKKKSLQVKESYYFFSVVWLLALGETSCNKPSSLRHISDYP